jgi:nucleoside-diphosphate-sugar epimerase
MQSKTFDFVFFGYGPITKRIIEPYTHNNRKILCVTNNDYVETGLRKPLNLEIVRLNELVKFRITTDTAIISWRTDENLHQNHDELYNWLLSGAFTTKKSIFLSSASVYKDSNSALDESPNNLDLNVKSNHKFILENHLGKIMKSKQVQHINLRISNVYGKNLKYGFIGSLSESLKNNSRLNVFNNLAIMRDYIFIEDVVYGIQEILKIKSECKILNLSTGIGMTIEQLLINAFKIGFQSSNIDFVSTPHSIKQSSILDCNKISELIKWKPLSLQESFDSGIIQSF